MTSLMNFTLRITKQKCRPFRFDFRSLSAAGAAVHSSNEKYFDKVLIANRGK